jgi:hypothetical protein
LILSAQISFVPADVAENMIDMSADWHAKVSFDGPRGKGETNFSLGAR